MEQISRGIYTQESREQAVKLVEVEGLSSREAAVARERLACRAILIHA
jgi:hypothetical protein